MDDVKTLYFKTNILLKNLVGKDLINDDNIAIVELVKNSYDANSKDVLVKFTNFSISNKSTEDSKIIILDRGYGMNLSDIEGKWLNIAYSEKKTLEQDRGSYLAGNKGIGRFSCDRLGKQLDLLTRRKGEKILHLQINWPDFEVEDDKNLTIQEIGLQVYTINEKEASTLAEIDIYPDHGTALIISHLRSRWDRERLKDLKTDLEKFINPNQLFLREKFTIILSAPSLADAEKQKGYSDRINGEVQNQIFENLKFNTTYIDSVIDHDNSKIKTNLYHEGEKVFELQELSKYHHSLGGTHIVIYYLNPYKKAYFKRQTGIRSVDFGSIFLFLNGFRVAPYGNRGDDWLGLDVRKTQGIARYLSSRDIVGRIEINGTEEYFKPISSREGLKNTEAFAQLREAFFLDILRKLEKFVVEGLQWDSVPKTIRDELRNEDGLDWEHTSEQYQESWDRKRQRIALSIMTLIGSTPDQIIKFWFNPSLLESIHETRQEEIRSLLSTLEDVEGDKVDPSLLRELNRFRNILERKEIEAREARAAAANLRLELAKKDKNLNQLSQENETYRAQTLFLQQVTTLDVKQLMSYHHQINLDSTILDNYLSKAIKELRDNSNIKSVLDILQKAALANKRIAAVAQYASKANFRSTTNREPTDIPAFFEQYLLRVAPDFVAAGLNLQVSNLVSELFEINISRLELSILIDNIISNANKAHAKKMNVSISLLSSNMLRISFIDDGKGLSDKISKIENIFDMGITTTSGSGLGLYHAKTIVEKVDGRISAIPLVGSGMEIRVEFIK